MIKENSRKIYLVWIVVGLVLLALSINFFILGSFPFGLDFGLVELMLILLTWLIIMAYLDYKESSK